MAIRQEEGIYYCHGDEPMVSKPEEAEGFGYVLECPVCKARVTMEPKGTRRALRFEPAS